MSPTQKEVPEPLETARNIWLATVRPNRAPHLAPIWFVWHDQKIYLCTAPSSVKFHNLAQNNRVALALEDGSHPTILEGTARALSMNDMPSDVAGLFKSKYDWDVSTGPIYTAVVEVTLARRLGW
ncbi:MAG: pyridoxamine 5'-phosphate oxidase family protein [Chloroflexi bacterium]|nr:pyridoxamine 5'-phosphate oxidase family protein [Chloroflexota bacterium]